MQEEKIFIYGASGAGKTTYSHQLEAQLNIPLVEADYLREVTAQKEKTEEEDPFVYVGTKEAFRKFGPLNEGNVIKGLMAVRKSMEPYISKEIENSHGPMIIEAAFLDPAAIDGRGKLILVVTTDEAKHQKQYFQHREQDDNHIETFQAARMIQAYLIKEAKQYSVQIIENDFDIIPL